MLKKNPNKVPYDINVASYNTVAMQQYWTVLSAEKPRLEKNGAAVVVVLSFRGCRRHLRVLKVL